MNAYIDTKIWLALRELLNPVVTDLAPYGVQLIEPAGSVPPDQAVLLISDVRAAGERLSIAGGRTLRSGNLILTVVWPVRRIITHTKLLQLAGMVALRLPEDHYARYEDICVRVSAEPSIRQPYRQEANHYCPVVVPWRND